jgi:hypothetical protein
MLSADDSVGSPHVKVGHCQAFKKEIPVLVTGIFLSKFVGIELKYCAGDVAGTL